MRNDIVDLRQFYYGSALGRVAQRILRERLLGLWPVSQCTGMSVAAMGFGAPLLRPYLASARRVTALMPAAQGVMAWPQSGPNHAVLTEPDLWPVDTGSLDRLLLLHALEGSDQPEAVWDEAWRTLGPGGRLVVMVPNRAGLWARSDATPFGVGRSYSAGQLEGQARRAGFVVERMGASIYAPPSSRRFWLRTALWWERTALRMGTRLIGGIVWAECTKQSPAPVGRQRAARLPNALGVLEGMGRPRPGLRPEPSAQLPRLRPSRSRPQSGAS